MMFGKLILTFENDNDIPEDLLTTEDKKIPMKIYDRFVTARIVRRTAHRDLVPEHDGRKIIRVHSKKDTFKVVLELVEVME